MLLDFLASLVTLTFLEIVLGIDNLVFIAVVTERLPTEQRSLARRLGLFMALFMRIALLFSIVWVTHLSQPLFSVSHFIFSWRDVVFIIGGLFLIYKGTVEIHACIEHDSDMTDAQHLTLQSQFVPIIMQIMLFDIIFSLDSIMTAVALGQNFTVMVIAILIAVGVMMAATNALSEFIERHPTIKILALSFMLLIGVMLIADGFQQHVPRAYIYFAIGFSIFIEFLNNRFRKKQIK